MEISIIIITMGLEGILFNQGGSVGVVLSGEGRGGREVFFI